MPEVKTKPSLVPVDTYLRQIEDPARRADCQSLIELMQKVTGALPVMWGSGIIGFGRYQYKYASGHSGESCLTGFASRKTDISLYTQVGFDGLEKELAMLGKHKIAKSCLYIKRLADIDLQVLERIVRATVNELQRRYP
ncbi:MAG: DUF1801 domain-containing protein [Burkholderiaceae bacterium]|nr:DUF1801 domain-containing protein [Burkholderiaceae bacterium]